MEIRDLLTKFDVFLTSRGLRFDGVAIGGAALNLIGAVSRYTRDCDILDPTIPDAIANASVLFAQEMRTQGNILRDDWFNNGPASLKKDLPKGWLSRVVPAFIGQSLTLKSLGRSDLIKTKVFAYCDRGTDRSDCILLSPSLTELKEALTWVKDRDANPQWPAHVKSCIVDLAKELGHEF